MPDRYVAVMVNLGIPADEPVLYPRKNTELNILELL